MQASVIELIWLFNSRKESSLFWQSLKQLKMPIYQQINAFDYYFKELMTIGDVVCLPTAFKS